MMRECCGRRTSLDHAPSCLVRRRPAAIATIANWYGLDPDDAGKWLDGAIKCALRKRTRRERESTVLVLELRDTCPTPRWRGGLFDDFQGSIPDPRRLTTNRRETCTA